MPQPAGVTEDVLYRPHRDWILVSVAVALSTAPRWETCSTGGSST